MFTQGPSAANARSLVGPAQGVFTLNDQLPSEHWEWQLRHAGFGYVAKMHRQASTTSEAVWRNHFRWVTRWCRRSSLLLFDDVIRKHRSRNLAAHDIVVGDRALDLAPHGDVVALHHIGKNRWIGRTDEGVH